MDGSGVVEEVESGSDGGGGAGDDAHLRAPGGAAAGDAARSVDDLVVTLPVPAYRRLREAARKLATDRAALAAALVTERAQGAALASTLASMQASQEVRCTEATVGAVPYLCDM
mgnify:CR=1 FL=1